MSILKTLPKRIPTNEEGIFYKSIINENNKEIDKIYLIRYREKDNDKLKTIGKYSQGIRINYCKQIRNEIIALGSKKLFLIKEIQSDEVTGRKDIILSRRDPEFIKQLFIREVPEVGNRTVTIEKVARDAGQRTKVAVFSTQKGIDPVGSCIGQKGSRIQSVLNELPTEEKVDVVAYSKNQNQFIINALSPAENVEIISLKDGVAEVQVPEDQLALAIGSGGENVRLAGILTDIDIKVSAKK